MLLKRLFLKLNKTWTCLCCHAIPCRFGQNAGWITADFFLKEWNTIDFSSIIQEIIFAQLF